MTGPQDPGTAGRDLVMACYADRERVIETLKTAFVDGRLTRDELGTRAGQALAARTRAELAALTADIPAEPAATRPERPPAPARRRPLARAAVGSGGCLVIAAAALRAAFILDPGPSGPTPHHSWARLMLLVAYIAVLTALAIMGSGVASSVEQRRSRGQLPPRPGPGGHTLDGEQRGGTGQGPVPPDQTRADQTRADLRVHQPRQRRGHVPAQAGQALRGARPTSGAA